jgi:hypothetical protein
MSKSRKFVDDMYSRHMTNPFNDREFVMKHGKGHAMFHMSHMEDDTVHIHDFRTHPQRSGVGGGALKEILGHAQRHGVKLHLHPEGYGDTPTKVLKKFYKKHGFKGNDSMTWDPSAKKKIIKEAFHAAFKTKYGQGEGKTTEVHKNPTRKEIHGSTQYDDVGGFLHHNDLYTFNRMHSLHHEVRDHIGADHHHLPVVISHRGKEAHVQVTDNSRHSKWHHNPDTEHYIRNHPQIKKHFKDVSVSYYDEDIHGNWSHMKKDDVNEEIAAPTNAVGHGAIAGIGIGPQGEPGRKANMMPMMRRKLDVLNRVKKEKRDK